MWMRLRVSFRLRARSRARTMLPSAVTVQRFDETINGREYHIEVSNVGTNQWRANIKRTPGGSAALMPFYGKTPDEAAGLLSHWLAIAHGQERTRL